MISELLLKHFYYIYRISLLRNEKNNSYANAQVNPGVSRMAEMAEYPVE